MRILVVDDSVVFRTQITQSLAGLPNIEVVGSAANGKIALQKIEQLSVDLITLDMEMPEMNGIETLKAMRAKGLRTKVIMFSSRTAKGAEKALEALREGADDVVAKPAGDQLNFEFAAQGVREALLPKILQFADKETIAKAQQIISHDFKVFSEPKGPRVSPYPKIPVDLFTPQVIVIASSTGGPPALESIFSGLKGPFRLPVLIAQHMPPVFTEILAKRLGEISGVPAKEAQDNAPLKPGEITVAPGDYHLTLQKGPMGVVIKTNRDPLRNSVRPAADFLFESAAQIYGSKCLGIVLTGMGEDGAAGAAQVRKMGGNILIQNKESCVVFGMPGAVFANDDYDGMGDLHYITHVLKKYLMN